MLDRQARLVAALALVLLSAGACSLVLPFGELQTGATGSGGGAATSSSASGGGCDKRCKGRCVGVDDPDYGCNAPSCTECLRAWNGAEPTCVNHVCGHAPEVLLSGLASPWAVEVGETSIFWSEEGVTGRRGGVHMLAKDHGSDTQLTMRDHARSVALGSDQVFYTSFESLNGFGNGVFAVAWNPPGSEQEINTNRFQANHETGNIDFDGARVFWSNGSDGKVYSQQFTDPDASLVHATGGNAPHSLRIGNGKLFLSEIVAAKVEKMLVDGGMLTPLWTDAGASPPSFLAIDANYLYVSGEGEQGAIFRLVRSEDAQVPLIIEPDAAGAGSIASGGDYVYWAATPDSGPPNISRHRTDGTGSTTVLAYPKAPRGIAVYADPQKPALYYLEAGTPGHADGKLMMLPLAAD